MIPARKHKFFNAWFSRHAEGRIRARFGDVWVSGLEAARAAVSEGPVLVVANHTSWWDPLVAIYLTGRVLGGDGYAMMDATNLERLPFFALVGAFGVNLQNARDGAVAIRYAAGLLREAGEPVARKHPVLWVFPQGRERPVTERPLGFRAGSAEVARVAKVTRILPLGLRYEFAARERPEMFIALGPTLAWNRDVVRGREEQEAGVTRELERIEEALKSGSRDGFCSLHRYEPGLWERLAERMLAWCTRPKRVARAAATGADER